MRRATGMCLLLLAGGRPVAAQWVGRLDVGVGGAPLERHGQVSHWSLAPALRIEGARLRLALGGDYRDFGRLGRGATGGASASWFPHRGQAWQLELAGELRAQGGLGLADRALGEAGPRLHLVRARHGFWLGGDAGADAEGPTFHWEGAWWRRWGALVLQLQAEQRSQSVTVSTANPIDTLPTFPDTLSERRRESRVLTDLGGWLSWQGRRVELRAAAGVRLGLAEPGTSIPVPGDGTRATAGGPRSRSEGWWQAEAAYWLSDRLAVAGMVGRQPGDASLLAPGGAFLRLGLRAAMGRRGTDAPRRAPRTGALLLTRLRGNLVEFALPAAEATRVELMGDFTDWRPVRLDPDGQGGWRVRLPVEPGLHRINVRYDGGDWRVPPGTRAVQDEFGTLAGELVIG